MLPLYIAYVLAVLGVEIFILYSPVLSVLLLFVVVLYVLLFFVVVAL